VSLEVADLRADSTAVVDPLFLRLPNIGSSKRRTDHFLAAFATAMSSDEEPRVTAGLPDTRIIAVIVRWKDRREIASVLIAQATWPVATRPVQALIEVAQEIVRGRRLPGAFLVFMRLFKVQEVREERTSALAFTTVYKCEEST
jgi:hypothetical protein